MRFSVKEYVPTHTEGGAPAGSRHEGVEAYDTEKHLHLRVSYIVLNVKQPPRQGRFAVRLRLRLVGVRFYV